MALAAAAPRSPSPQCPAGWGKMPKWPPATTLDSPTAGLLPSTGEHRRDPPGPPLGPLSPAGTAGNSRPLPHAVGCARTLLPRPRVCVLISLYAWGWEVGLGTAEKEEEDDQQQHRVPRPLD